MKRILCTLIFAAAMGVALLAHANPPSAIHANYDTDRQELNVLVQHGVSDREAHYIDKVVVKKNGAEVATKGFTSQASKRDQVMPPFKIPAAAGDRFEIVATCNKFGSATQTVVIP